MTRGRGKAVIAAAALAGAAVFAVAIYRAAVDPVAPNSFPTPRPLNEQLTFQGEAEGERIGYENAQRGAGKPPPGNMKLIADQRARNLGFTGWDAECYAAGFYRGYLRGIGKTRR